MVPHACVAYCILGFDQHFTSLLSLAAEPGRTLLEVHHARLLLAILRQRWDLAEELVGVHPPASGPFFTMCEACEVDPWVHAVLAGAGRFDLVGDEVAQQLGRARSKIQRQNLLMIERSQQAVDALSQVDVVPVFLKGLDLVHRVYSRFDERQMRDVDMLVSGDDLPRALDALLVSGWKAPPEPDRTQYVRRSHHLPLTSPGTATVKLELHWNLVQATRFNVDVDGLIERALPLDIGGRPVLRLEDHDLVAHLLLHHFTHYFDRRLKWAIDLKTIVQQPGFQWERVMDKFRVWHAEAASGASLLHIRKWFPEWVPDFVLRRFRVARWRRFLLSPLRSHHPLDLFRGTRRRKVQLYLAAVLYEQPSSLPRWLIHRSVRDERRGPNPLDAG